MHSDVVANTELGFPSAMDGGEAVKVALEVEEDHVRDDRHDPHTVCVQYVDDYTSTFFR